MLWPLLEQGVAELLVSLKGIIVQALLAGIRLHELHITLSCKSHRERIQKTIQQMFQEG